MRTVRITSGGPDKNRSRTADVPDTWEEGVEMLQRALDPFYEARGSNSMRSAIAGRVALGLFHPESPNPTIALLKTMLEFCEDLK